NGAGSNGSVPNGSDGAGSNGSGSNGSDGAGSNGSGSNGSDGAGSNGSGSNGSGSNGSNDSGSGSSNGSGSTGSGSNSSGSGSSNGSGSTSTGSNGSGSTVNNPATSEGTAAATAGEETGNAVDRKLNHNAYFYNKDGKRANLLVAKKGSVISTYKQESINGRDFYLTDNGLYVAVNNFKEQTRLLKKNAFLYSSKGKRISTKLLKKNTKVKTYGDPVTIKGKQYYITTGNRYVKAANFAVAAKEANNVVADGVTANAILEHDAYIYNDEGKRINRVVLKAGSQLATGETKTIDGRQFIEIGKGHYVASDNVTGTARKLSTKAYVYDQHGQRIGKQTLKKNDTVQTYGEPVKKGGQEFYIIGNNKFVKKGVVK
ncbi:SLAP domain-containing protein, partial [Lactobacillus sp.]|uniref:SLAP domain-containing protein n=1 Tax=Lactobacillus sp. TaxID=1591 RepID=UPI0025EE1A14